MRLSVTAGVVRAEAAALGVVTRAANSHCVATVTPSGRIVNAIRRDAIRPARPAHVAARPWRRRSPAPLPPAADVLVTRTAHGNHPPLPRHEGQVAAADRQRKRRREDAAMADFRLRQIIADQHAGAQPQPTTDRFLALRARIVARESAARDGLSR